MTGQSMTTSADPLAIVLDRYRLSGLKLLLIAVLSLNLPIWLYAWATDTFHSHQGLIGLLDDYNTLVVFSIGAPLTILFYSLFPSWIYEAVASITTNNVISEPRTDISNGAIDFEGYVSQLNSDDNQRHWYIFSCVIVLLFQAVFLVPQHLRFRTVPASNSILLAYTELWFFVAYYATVVTAIRGLIFTRWLSALFSRFKVRVRILHPDACGGLGSIGEVRGQDGLCHRFMGSHPSSYCPF